MVNKDRIMPLPTKECRQARHNECSDLSNCTCYCHRKEGVDYGYRGTQEEEYE